MTVELQKHATARKYTVLSTDPKPVLGLSDVGALLYETDTSTECRWNGAQWVLILDHGRSIPEILTHETDIVSVLHEISNKLSILLEYEAIMHGIKLDGEM